MKDNILKTAVFYAVGSLIAQVISLLSVFLFMKELTLSEFGLYGIVFECFTLLQMVVFNSFRNIYLQDFRSGDFDLDSKIFTQLTLGSFVLLLITALCTYIFKIKIELSVVLFISLFLNSLSIPIFAKFLVDNQRFILVFKDVLVALFLLAAAFFTTKFHKNFSIEVIVSIQIMVSGIISFSFFLLYFFKRSFSIKFFKFKLNMLYPLFVFLGIFFINSFYNKMAVIAFNNVGDMVFLAVYLGALKFVSPFMFVNNALVQAYIPRFMSDSFNNFNAKVFFHFFIPSLVIALALYCFFPLILNILDLQKYYQSYELVKIFSLYLISVFIYGSLSNFINVNGGQKIVLFVNIIVLIIYALFLFFLVSYNIVDPKKVAAGYVFLEIFTILVYCLYLTPKVKISYFYFISPLFLWLLLFLFL